MNTKNATEQQNSTHKSAGKSKRGFASMDKDKHKLVSSKGGKSERRDKTNESEPRPTRPTPTGYDGF